MKIPGMARRLLAFTLALAICFSLVPWTVFAAETGTYTQVTSAEEFTTGQYVLVTDTGYAPTVLDGSWILAAQPAVADGIVTDTAGAVWTLTVDGTSVKLTDANGTSIAPKGGNNNGIKSGDYSWAWSFENGKFTFAGTGSDTVILASNTGSDNKFRGYKTTTVSGNPAGYPSTFTLYKLVEETAEPDPSEPAPSDPVVPEVPAWADVDAKYDVYELVTAPASGDTVVLYNPGNAKALSSENSGYYKAGVDAAVTGEGYIASDSETIAWTVTIGENGLWNFTQNDLKLGVELSGSYINLKTNAGDYNFLVTPYTEGGDLYRVRSATVENSYGFAYLEWYASKNAFSAYAAGEAKATEQNFGFKFYKLVREGVAEEEPEIPTDPSEPEGGETTGTTWTKVDLADITDTDTIAITMSKDGTTWVLPVIAEGSKGQPLATYTGTIEGDKLTTDAAEPYSWNIAATEGGYHIKTGESYLYVTADNNGVRIGKTAAVWNVAEGYLASADSKNTTRYLGVYNSQDWRCYKNTTGNTAGQTLGFWKLDTAEEEPEVPEVTGIADGDYVIWAPAYNLALSSTKGGYSNYYNVGVAVTETEGKLTGAAATEIWTVKNNEDGTITISQNGQALGLGDSFTSMNLGEKHSTWTLTDNGDGTWNVVNVGRGNTLEYSSYGTWQASATISEPGRAAVKFTPASDIIEEEPVPTVYIEDGRYVLWVGGQYNMALSGTYPIGSYYNAGVSVTMDGDKLTGYGETEIWTVTNHDDGTITISMEGQNLGMADSFSSMSLGAVNDKWTLTPAGDGRYYVKNVGREQYIQWRAGTYNYFSCYYLSENDAFAINFTPAEAEEETAGIADGDYVIWAPAFNKALSSTYGSYYNNGVDVALNGDILTGYENTEIWTVTNLDDGTITISCAGGKLAMDTGFSSMPLNAVHDTWVIEDAGIGLYYVKNVGRECYIEWYSDKGYWSGYKQIDEGKEDLFALCFTPVEKGYDTDSSVVEDIAQWGGMTNSGNTAFIYGDKYVSGDEADTEDIFTAVVSGSVVTPWTKGGSDEAPLYYMGGAGLGSGSDDYLQLSVNAAGWGDLELSFRLRASNSGPGSFQLKYSTDGGVTWQNFTTGSYAYAYTGYGSDGSSYPVTGEGAVSDGIARPSYAPTKYVSFVFDVPAGADNCGELLIRLVPGTDKANGKAGNISATGTVRFDSVVLSGSPVVDASVTGFVTVTPDGTVDQPTGTQLTMTSATEGATIYYRVGGGQWLVYDESNKPALDTLPCDIEAYAVSEGKADSVVLLYHYSAGTVESVKFSPNGGGIFIEGESAEIILSTATEGATIYYATSTDGETFGEFREYTGPIVVEKGFGKVSIQAYAEKDGYKTSTLVTRHFTERISGTYQIFFGQLHSHTNISDGSGSVEEAFAHAYEVKNLDFLAVTDHSNSFDSEGNGILAQDGSAISKEWAAGHAAAESVTDGSFVGLYGFEMTWSNGLGHLNTFNTPGWQSRTQSQFTNANTALQNYYQALATVPESISQFNHPGTTFGDFSDFAHYTEATDALITLIEVGNGEGAIGSSGYFPSYEYYTRALDKGWHVAPTNNQDNHKGLWGDANTGRSVILADSLTPEDIYDALRNYRVYATEDNDLHIYYTLNGYIMGSQLEISDVEESLTISVTLSDATDSAIGKVEVIVNGGLTAASTTASSASETVTLTVPADYNYYYIKITQPDGDIAVTAPVWVGKVEAVGIASLKAESALTITGQEQTITAELFNNEKTDLVVESLVYTNKATGQVLYTETGITSVPKESTATSSFGYTFLSDGVYTITATLKGTLNGVEKVYTKDLEITVMPQSVTSRIIVDGTHYNDYVTGYYGGNTSNMTAIAATQGIQVHVEKNAITPEMLDSCSLLIISAPVRKSGTAGTGDYVAKPFEDEFIAMVAEYVKNGGSVVVCGLADYQDKAATYGADGHAAAQLNKLLTAIGSTMRIHDDEAYDEMNNGGQAYRLYPQNFNMDSQWCAGIIGGDNGQKYSQYSGCTVDPGEGTWLVRGFDTTYSIDSDNDGLGGVEKGEAVFMAVEDTGFGGQVFVAGGVFMSDFEVKAEMDNIWDLPYANRTIFENIIGITRQAPEVTPIAEVRASAETELGRIFVIEGYVTAGTDNEYTTFFDAIYVQDETGGITVFPYAETGLALGTKVRITGYTDAYQGDIEIQIMSVEILDAPKNIIEPQQVSNADAMNYAENGGELLKVEGEVVEVILSNSRAAGQSVSRFVLKDENGDLATVFIDGYILSGTTGENTLADIVKVGNTVSAVGLLYMHPEGDSTESVAVLRVRNCDEVILISEKVETDKSALEQAIKTAKAKKETAYTKTSWAAMAAALEVAESVYADENATQEEIDAATAALNAAIKALVPRTGKNPATADGFAPELCLMIMTGSVLALAVLLLGRKRFAV